MTAFYTPNKAKKLTALIGGTISLAPIVVFVHFFVRSLLGDYPPEADSVGIPIFGYWLFVFPFSVLLWIYGLRRWVPGISLFAWKWRPVGRTLWTAVSVYPVGLASVAMILDGIEGRLYWVSAFFTLHVYCILVLRASIVAHEPDRPSDLIPCNL